VVRIPVAESGREQQKHQRDGDAGNDIDEVVDAERDAGETDCRNDPRRTEVSLPARPDRKILGQTQIDDRRHEGVAAREAVAGRRRSGPIQRVDRLRQRLDCHEHPVGPREREDLFQPRDQREAGQRHPEDGRGFVTAVRHRRPVDDPDEEAEKPHVAELGHQPEQHDTPVGGDRTKRVEPADPASHVLRYGRRDT